MILLICADLLLKKHFLLVSMLKAAELLGKLINIFSSLMNVQKTVFI